MFDAVFRFYNLSRLSSDNHSRCSSLGRRGNVAQFLDEDTTCMRKGGFEEMGGEGVRGDKGGRERQRQKARHEIMKGEGDCRFNGSACQISDREQTARSRQQTEDNREQTAGNRQQREISPMKEPMVAPVK
jgi:hypothetical protein